MISVKIPLIRCIISLNWWKLPQWPPFSPPARKSRLGCRRFSGDKCVGKSYRMDSVVSSKTPPSLAKLKNVGRASYKKSDKNAAAAVWRPWPWLSPILIKITHKTDRIIIRLFRGQQHSKRSFNTWKLPEKLCLLFEFNGCRLEG